MSSFLLLHGAFRGGWSWDAVVERLGEHAVQAPDLLGAGTRYTPGMPPVTVRAVLDDLVPRVEGDDLIVAGHSQGGFIARALSQRLPERIRVLAYLDAPVPRHGEAARDLVPGGSGPVPDLDPNEWIPPTGEDPRMTPVSVAMSTEPIVLDDPRALALPERFAFCSQTPRMFPCWHTRARLDSSGAAYDVIQSDHDAPLTAPDAVAAWLRRIDEETR